MNDSETILEHIRALVIVLVTVTIVLVISAYSQHQSIVSQRKLSNFNAERLCLIVTSQHLPDPHHLCGR